MKKSKILALLLALPLVAVFLAACGGDDEGESASPATDAAFVTEMIPHHDSAIEMAKIAQKRAEHPEIKQLADDIVATQSAEIETLNQISDDLGDQDAGASLGLSSDEMGMSMDTSMLETAEPFDREFIDMMVPHHQGAILMAHAELADGTNSDAKALADEILTGQSGEIEEMNSWRTKWYGGPSPAGGIPEYEGSADGGHESMDH